MLSQGTIGMTIAVLGLLAFAASPVVAPGECTTYTYYVDSASSENTTTCWTDDANYVIKVRGAWVYSDNGNDPLEDCGHVEDGDHAGVWYGNQFTFMVNDGRPQPNAADGHQNECGLQEDPSGVDPNANHEYCFVYTQFFQTLRFRIRDGFYPDNSGSVRVDVSKGSVCSTTHLF